MISNLSLTTEKRYGSTDIADMYFTVPYKITSPFKNGEHSDIMIMSASAGILGGDIHNAEFTFGENTDTTILSQSYEKLMDTDGTPAMKNININVKENAKAIYLPQPIIPFANSEYISNTEIYLNKNCRFIYSDIFSCGRIGMGEKFLLKSFHGKTKIHIEERLVFADNTVIKPMEFNYSSICQWQNYSHNGLMYIYLPNNDELNEIITEVRQIKGDFEIGISRSINGVSVRMLASSGDEIYKCFSLISSLI